MNRYRSATWIGLILFLFAFPYVVFHDSFFLNTMIYLLFFVVLGAGLNLIMTTGQLSIGQAAFAAIGAYTSVILVMKFNVSFWLSWFAAGISAGLLSWILGRITLRIKGVYFAILTFGFGEVVHMVFKNSDYFGGITGIMAIPPPTPISIGPITISFITQTEFYYLVLVFCLISMVIYSRLINSQIGRVFEAIEQADYLAECCGINIMKYKVLAFVVGSVMAGGVGALYAPYFSYISPDSFTFAMSIDLIIINVVGGIGTLTGPIFGAIFLVCLPEFLRSLKEYELVFYAISLILALFFMPQGIAGAIKNIGKKKK